MNPDQEKKTIESWATKAIAMMKEHDVLPMPENYTLWFEYIRGGNKALISAMDELLKDKKPFDRDICRELYNNHILREVNNKAVEDAGAKVQQIMSNVLKSIETSSTDTAKYTKDLEKFESDVQVDGGKGITDVIGKIVKRTQELKEKGKTLTEKLSESQSEVEVLRENLEEVSLQVSLDALTGIANRKAFDETLRIMMNEATETGKDLCLLMVDVDHFKQFNDNHGHLLGDQVLRIVATAMTDLVKGQDFVARYGGEEFSIILPETPLHGGTIVAENVRKTIAARELKRKDTGESYGKITVSIGMTPFKHRYDSAEDLIARADKALYVAKDNGRNRVEVET